MSKIKSLLRAYSEKSLVEFFRFLLYKEYEYRTRQIHSLKTFYNKQLFLSRVTKIGTGFHFGPREIDIRRSNNSMIVVGNDVTIYTPINITATDHIFPESIVKIGDRTRIGSNTSIRAAKRVVIGKDCLIAQCVRIYDYNGHPLAPGNYKDMKTLRNQGRTPQQEVNDIVIGNNVWIGENAFVQRGVTIGDGAIVSANSVVIKDVAPNTVVFGNPARKILWLDDSKESAAS